MSNDVCLPKLTIWWRNCAARLLAASWLIGVLLGLFAAGSSGEVLSSIVRQNAAAKMTLSGLMMVSILPFLFSAFAITFSEPWLLLIISTFKAFSFSFCAWGVCLAFGQCGWLVLFLLQFSDILLIPLLYFYWLRNIRGDRIPRPWELPLFLGIAFGIGCIDYWYIAPFLASLMA